VYTHVQYFWNAGIAWLQVHHDWVGWVGAIAFIVAYLFLSIGRLSAESHTYHLLNIIGAVCLIINSYFVDDYPNIVTNVVWIGIAAWAMRLIGLKKPKAPPKA
jgi:hypothetical protein